MFEKFTDGARRVVVLAQDEARLLGNNHIGTEHLLLALVHESDSVAGEALASAGITLQAMRQRVLDAVGEGGEAPSGHIPFTPRAKRTLELALNVAMRMGDDYIGTAHLLLSVLGQPDGAAAQMLAELGADSSALEQHVVEARTDHPERLQMGGPAR